MRAMVREMQLLRRPAVVLPAQRGRDALSVRAARRAARRVAAHQRRARRLQAPGRAGRGRQARQARAQQDSSTRPSWTTLRQRQIDAVKYLDSVVEELFDLVPKNTYITITSDHGELFGEERLLRTRADPCTRRCSKCRSSRASSDEPASHSTSGLHRTRRRLRLPRLLPHAARPAFVLSVVSVPALAVPHAWRRAGSARQGFRKTRREEADLPGPRRPRSRAHRAVHGRRQAAQSQPPCARRAASTACAPPSPRSRRWPGPPSPPA